MAELVDVNQMDYKRRYKIGTRYIDVLGQIFRYVKIDFGSAGKINNKIKRIVQYRWIQVRL